MEKPWVTQFSDKTEGLRILFKDDGLVLVTCHVDHLYNDVVVSGWTEYVNSPETFAVKIMNEVNDPVFEDPLVMHACYIYLTNMAGSDDYIEDAFDLLKQIKEEEKEGDSFSKLIIPLAECFTCHRIAVADYIEGGNFNTICGKRSRFCTECRKEANSPE